jgi:hypothetical protein
VPRERKSAAKNRTEIGTNSNRNLFQAGRASCDWTEKSVVTYRNVTHSDVRKNHKDTQTMLAMITGHLAEGTPCSSVHHIE